MIGIAFSFVMVPFYCSRYIKGFPKHLTPRYFARRKLPLFSPVFPWVPPPPLVSCSSAFVGSELDTATTDMYACSELVQFVTKLSHHRLKCSRNRRFRYRHRITRTTDFGEGVVGGGENVASIVRACIVFGDWIGQLILIG